MQEFDVGGGLRTFVNLETGKIEVIEIDGIQYSREIFTHFAEAAEAGSLFRFVKRENGVVTVERPGPEIFRIAGAASLDGVTLRIDFLSGGIIATDSDGNRYTRQS
jgi:hypothetical protein